MSRQPAKAALAAAMARSTSSGSANGTRPSTAPVAGLRTSSPRLPLPSVHSPSMYSAIAGYSLMRVSP